MNAGMKADVHTANYKSSCSILWQDFSIYHDKNMRILLKSKMNIFVAAGIIVEWVVIFAIKKTTI